MCIFNRSNTLYDFIYINKKSKLKFFILQVFRFLKSTVILNVKNILLYLKNFKYFVT